MCCSKQILLTSMKCLGHVNSKRVIGGAKKIVRTSGNINHVQKTVVT
jgi:hypothetical protein